MQGTLQNIHVTTKAVSTCENQDSRSIFLKDKGSIGTGPGDAATECDAVSAGHAAAFSQRQGLVKDSRDCYLTPTRYRTQRGVGIKAQSATSLNG